MRRLIQSSLCCALLLSLVGIAIAQDNSQANGEKASLTVTGSASSERARFTGPSSAVEIRLEVYNSAGSKVFDNQVRGGNVFDWNLQDGQAKPLAEGSYVCVVTVKSLSGRTTQKLGSLIVEAGAARLQPVDAGQLTTQQTQSVGPVGEDSTLTIVRDDGPETTTVTAHNGEDGQIVRGQGALSFRLGDFFRGADQEQMRLTPGGNLGIGITHPLVRLDVDGLVRASEGIVFPDGSIQYSAATRTFGAKSSLPDPTFQSIQSQSGKKSSGGQEHIDAAGTGTLNFIARWAETGGAGTLSNSSIFDDGFLISIGTMMSPTPGAVFDLQRASSSDILQRIWNTGTGGAKLRYVASVGATSQIQLTDFDEWLTSIAGNNSIGLQFRVRDVGDANDEATLAARPRMSILRNGNVGIGTTSPIGPLEVIASGNNAVVSTSFGGGLGNSPGFVGRSARGTASSPSATLAGDFLANLRGRGFGATAFLLASGAINIRAAENFTDTAQGTLITFETTPIGSTSAASAERMRIDHNGNVGIGTTNPISLLDVFGGVVTIRSTSGNEILAFDNPNLSTGYIQRNVSTGNIEITPQSSKATLFTGDVLPISDASQNLGSGSFRWNTLFASNGTINTSDARLKQRVTNLGYGLNQLLQLRPVTFQWKDHNDGRTHLGLIAQEVEKIMPEVVQRSSDPSVPLGMSYTELVPVLIKAIQEQHSDFAKKDTEIDSLKAENAALKEQNAEMDARITTLERAMQQFMGQQQPARQISPQQPHR